MQETKLRVLTCFLTGISESTDLGLRGKEQLVQKLCHPLFLFALIKLSIIGPAGGVRLQKVYNIHGCWII